MPWLVYRTMTEEERSYLQRAVPVINHQGRPYCVRLDAVPTPWRGALQECIRRESIPLFNDGAGDCIYAWDWRDWLADRLYCPF